MFNEATAYSMTRCPPLDRWRWKNEQ